MFKKLKKWANNVVNLSQVVDDLLALHDELEGRIDETDYDRLEQRVNDLEHETEELGLKIDETPEYETDLDALGDEIRSLSTRLDEMDDGVCTDIRNLKHDVERLVTKARLNP